MKISKRDVFWSYLGYFFKYGASLMILPFLLYYLNKQEVGIWYLFTALGSLVMLFDFGFAPTIMRNISYSWGGATHIQKQGISQSQGDIPGPNYRLLYQLIMVSRRLYLYIAVLAFVLIMVFGTLYIVTTASHLANARAILMAWFIYCLGSVCNLYFSYWTSILMGIGAIEDSQRAVVVSQVVYGVVSILGLMLGGGLIAVSAAFFCNGIVLRLLSMRYFHAKTQTQDWWGQYQGRITFRDCRVYVGILGHTAYRLGLVSVGGYLIQQSNTIICSRFLGLETTASYGLALQLIVAISSFSHVIFRSNIPFFSEARLRNAEEELKQSFSASVMVAWLSYWVGASIVIAFGALMLQAIGSNTPLPGRALLSFMFFYMFLEFNHGSLFASFITTKNEVPFVPAALWSGFFIIVFSLLFVKYTHFGLFGLVLSQCLVQLAYNNWKWPYVVLRELNMNMADLIRNGYHYYRGLLKAGSL